MKNFADRPCSFMSQNLKSATCCVPVVLLLIVLSTSGLYAQDSLPWNAPENNPAIAPSSPSTPTPQVPSYKPQPGPITPTNPNNYVPPRNIAPNTAPVQNAPAPTYRAPQYSQPQTYRNPNQPLPQHSKEYNSREIQDAGHRFFGSISVGMAKVIEHAFASQGRPNGYILGEEAGGAFIAGVRYGEGTLYTKDAGTHKVFWQGPSLGYDFGAEGSKVMILIYNLRSPAQIYQTFSGVAGSAFFIGGVGITFQKGGNVTAAPIRSGVGLRIGANVGYLKYTRSPTWNPF